MPIAEASTVDAALPDGGDRPRRDRGAQMHLTHRFTVDHPVEEVWPTLTDLRTVAACVPGAAVTSVEDDGTHHGQLTVRLGAVRATFNGTARFAEVDEDRRVVRLVGSGQSGQGGAQLTLEGRMAPEGAGARVTLDSEVTLTGRVAQLGQRLAGVVTAQVLDAFVERLTAVLDKEEAAAPTAALDIRTLVPATLRDPRVAAAGLLLLAAVAVALSGRSREPLTAAILTCARHSSPTSSQSASRSTYGRIS